MTCVRKRTVEMSLQSFNPFAERAFAARTETDEQVHMIRHDDVSPDADAMLDRSTSVIQEGSVNACPREKSTAAVGIERDEEDRRIVFLKYPFQTRRFSLSLLLHRKRCSVRCSQRTSLDELKPPIR